MASGNGDTSILEDIPENSSVLSLFHSQCMRFFPPYRKTMNSNSGNSGYCERHIPILTRRRITSFGPEADTRPVRYEGTN